MKLIIGCDHAGVGLKELLKDFLNSAGHETIDAGAYNTEASDYPDFAVQVAEAVITGVAERGILICTTGIGMSVCANRFHGIRATVVSNNATAKSSREHNNSNVIVLAAASFTEETAKEALKIWLETEFTNAERHVRRLEKVDRCNRLAESAILAAEDPEIHAAIIRQIEQEDTTINLIASENLTSAAVRAAQGSVLTNKYAEGYPGKRWYSGCEPVDAVERLAIERAKELFGAEAANVQPHCGSSANMAVYFAMLKPGDTILSLSLDQGGHLSHGSPVNFSGQLYNIVPYTVDEKTECLDYDAIAKLARDCKPKMIVGGASAYPRTLDFGKFREIADEVGAYLLVDMAHIAGLVAGGSHPSPVPYCDFVTSTTHKTMRGPRGGLILCKEKYIAAINKTVFPGIQGGPLENAIAAKAVCFKEAMQPSFKDYALQIVKNSKVLAEKLIEFGYTLVSGGSDNHLMLVNVMKRGISGKVAAAALDAAGIICNKNAIPFDTQSPFVTSGIRIGTAAVTARGMKEPEMIQIATWIHEILSDVDNTDLQQKIRAEVKTLAAKFLVP